jgi:LysW-gamma-L-alpha-aminoadipyl-6-phosphate/LysW-L-glutamyl-5-phosphate reductase
MKVSIVGASGYTGGELLRLLLQHPEVEIFQVTSESNVGKFVHHVHPNLRGQRLIKFCSISQLKPCDLLFLAMPHGKASEKIDDFTKIAPKIIDLSADFRIKDNKLYRKFYGKEHPNPEALKEFVYGLPELHREEIKKANFVSGVGCNATAVILALYPLFKSNAVESVVAEVKAGSSEPGTHRAWAAIILSGAMQ